MTSVIFRDDSAKKKMSDWFSTFRSAVPFHTESRYLDTPHGRTHVLIGGAADGPPLVCLHGALATSAHAVAELAPLAERYRLYAVDVVGQSVMSEDRRLDLDGSAYGDWFREVCSALGLERTAVFGVSWGGFVAMRGAAAAPDVVSALVLLVPAGVVTGPAWTGFTRVGLPMLAYQLFPTDARLEKAFLALFSERHERWMSYFGDALRSYRLDMRVPPLLTPQDLAPYRGPVLAFGAEHDLQFPGAPLLRRVRELVSIADTELLFSSKHCPPMNEIFRARLAARIDEFLSARDASSVRREAVTIGTA